MVLMENLLSKKKERDETNPYSHLDIERKYFKYKIGV